MHRVFHKFFRIFKTLKITNRCTEDRFASLKLSKGLTFSSRGKEIIKCFLTDRAEKELSDIKLFTLKDNQNRQLASNPSLF